MADGAQALLNWQRLYEWTQQKEPGAVLGESCTNSSCPLALYLNEQTGQRWSIGPSIRRDYQTSAERLHKPRWVKALIEGTDEATGHERGPVTREQFLSVLEQVRELAEPYTPTPADEALYLTLLTGQMHLTILQEFNNGTIANLEAYNRLYAVASKVDSQARKLFDQLERAEQSTEE